MARSRRRGDLDDPALGWKRHDRALGRHVRAHMMPDGVEQALADADLALRQLAPDEWLAADRATSPRHCARAARRDRSRDGRPRRQRSRRGWRPAPSRRSYVAQAQLALLAAKRGAWGEAERRARAGTSARRGGRPRRLRVERARATRRRRASRSTRYRQEDARAALARAHRLRPLLDHGFPG